jgi:hypothetical protein
MPQPAPESCKAKVVTLRSAEGSGLQHPETRRRRSGATDARFFGGPQNDRRQRPCSSPCNRTTAGVFTRAFDHLTLTFAPHRLYLAYSSGARPALSCPERLGAHLLDTEARQDHSTSNVALPVLACLTALAAGFPAFDRDCLSCPSWQNFVDRPRSRSARTPCAPRRTTFGPQRRRHAHCCRRNRIGSLQGSAKPRRAVRATGLGRSCRTPRRPSRPLRWTTFQGPFDEVR